MEGIKVPSKNSENSKIARGIFSGAHPLELGPQGIPEALRAAQGDLESTFVRSKTMPGPQKLENLENGIFFVHGQNFVRENFVRGKFGPPTPLPRPNLPWKKKCYFPKFQLVGALGWS